PRYWRTAEELPPAPPPAGPLSGLRVAIDPGHIGGVWAEMEERSFRIDDRPPLREGDLTLRTARILKPMLEDLGADVHLVRRSAAPVTTLRIEDLEEEARQALAAAGRDPSPEAVRRE